MSSMASSSLAHSRRYSEMSVPEPSGLCGHQNTVKSWIGPAPSRGLLYSSGLTSQVSVAQVLPLRVMRGAPHCPGGPAAVVTSVGSEYAPN